MQRPESTSNSSSISNIPQKEQTQQALKPIRYIHGHTPIKLTRQMLKNTHCYTVLSNVECQIETLKTSSKGTIRIKKIYRFRFDEDKIWVYKCNKSLAFDIKEMPQCPPDAPCYSYDSMPAEYWLMYIYACRFMTIVRSKISKVIIYTDVAKAVLFDLPDLFEVRFFADSTRIIFGDVIRIVKASGIMFLTRNFIIFSNICLVCLRRRVRCDRYQFGYYTRGHEVTSSQSERTARAG